MNLKMKWFDETSSDYDVAVTTRVRLARNLEKTPFPALLDNPGRKEVISSVRRALSSKLGGTYADIDFGALPAAQAQSYVEYHTASPDFLKCQGERNLMVLNNESVSIMVNEEDHLRIQGISAGFSVDNAYSYANSVDDLLSASLPYAFDEEFGYLTSCPTNLGTGMRASVMLHLPALTATGDIEKLNYQISKLGLIMRGFYGEGSRADGNLYQVSNQITLGITEEATLEKLRSVCGQIIGYERAARKAILESNYDDVRDRVQRSLGVALHAYRIPPAELYRLYSDLRLGISCQLLKGIKASALDRMLLECQPANTALRQQGQNPDVVRAEYIKTKLSSQ